MSEKDYEREVQGLQEILGFVLLSIGEPVFVTKDAMMEGFGQNMQISIDESESGFLFYLSKEGEGD